LLKVNVRTVSIIAPHHIKNGFSPEGESGWRYETAAKIPSSLAVEGIEDILEDRW
jgi:hypothetical protein